MRGQKKGGGMGKSAISRSIFVRRSLSIVPTVNIILSFLLSLSAHRPRKAWTNS